MTLHLQRVTQKKQSFLFGETRKANELFSLLCGYSAAYFISDSWKNIQHTGVSQIGEQSQTRGVKNKVSKFLVTGTWKCQQQEDFFLLGNCSVNLQLPLLHWGFLFVCLSSLSNIFCIGWDIFVCKGKAQNGLLKSEFIALSD